MPTIEVKVPDIGDFKDVPVIEVLVKPGDKVAKESSLVTLESDKATMDVPSPVDGTVRELKVKVGDKVGEGSLILTVETGAAAAAPQQAAPAAAAPKAASAAAPAAPAAPIPGAKTYSGKADVECEMLVLGAGPGGYSAAFRSADLGMKTVLVERYATLGGVCLNVGCIPSKALLHTAFAMDEVIALGAHGIAYGSPTIDLPKLKTFKESVVKKLTGGLTGMAKARKVEVVRGVGRFLDPHHLEVALTTGTGQDRSGEKKVVKFGKCIIAAGSQAIKLPFMPDDPRVVDSTGALELTGVPKRMLVVGAGIIGLEMATVYSALGSKIDVVEMLDIVMAGADRDLVKVWEKMNAKRFDKIMLKTKTVSAKATPQGIVVGFEGENAPSGPQTYDPCSWPWAAARTARSSRRPAQALPSPTAASSRSTSRCAPTCRISTPSATSSASRCSRTRPCTKRTSRQKPRRARSRSSTRARSRRSPTRTPRLRGPGSPRTSAGSRASSTARPCSRGLRQAAPSPTGATKALRSSCSTRRRIVASAAASSARTPAT
jgi:dihydrolipoamide dehydrogenase